MVRQEEKAHLIVPPSLVIRNCEFCGHPLPPAKKTGRPQIYHPRCKKAFHLIGWLQDELLEIQPTPEKKKAIRANLWNTANLLNYKVKK